MTETLDDTLNQDGKKYIVKKIGAKTIRNAEIIFARYIGESCKF